ncbi:hypothetical protein L4D76_18480 [Photobacterium sagamiensis]|uniref:hypothetical protein n=1 Tax=Photobacterium sagamiensis TaxID=2910241 RepID=UPI003D0B9CBF
MDNLARNMGSAFSFTSWSKYARKQQDYMTNVVKPLFLAQDWDSINKLPVLIGDNGDVLISFKDDIWPIRKHLGDTGYDHTKLANLHFFAYDYAGTQVEIGASLPKRFKLELKLFAYYCLFLAPKLPATLTTVYQTVGPLKTLAMESSEYGLSSFEELTVPKLREMIELGYVEIQQKTIPSLNLLTKAVELPLNFDTRGKFTSKEFPSLLDRDGEQNQVIPLAVYKTLFEQTEAVVNEFYSIRNDLADKLRDVQNRQREYIEHVIVKAIRTGSGFGGYLKQREADKIIERFKSEGVVLVDNFSEGERWRELFDEIEPIFRGVNIKPHTTPRMRKMKTKGYDLEITGHRWEGLAEFKDTLSEIDAACRFLTQALSGMRTDELWRIHPDFALQYAHIKGQKIYLLTTRQSKITKGSGTVNDVYVTTEMGAKAYQLLNAIHKPLRENFTINKNRFFGGFKGFLKRKPQGKDTKNINKYVKRWLADYKLSDDDIDQLNMSNPDRTTNLVAGEAFKFNPHQLRRSLAYYLIGFELLAYPQLKQQFSHFSVAMTRWYARYADSFARMHRQLEAERLDQKAQIMARIHKKIANGERIGGGKASEIHKNMAKNGKSYYAEGDGGRVMSVEYWKRTIKSGVQHIHAIAPNMYCTSASCSMRITIDLSDCVDCGFDLFEFATYAEHVRKEAEVALYLAEEMDEINPPNVARQVVQIKSAEKLMADMGVPFEPVEIPKEWEDMVIHWEAA